MTSATLFATALLAGAVAGGPQIQDPPLKPGNGVSAPVLVRDVKPSYTPGAMKRRVTGLVAVELVVEIDGSVSNVRVVRPLDPELDDAAVVAVRRWQFKPGLRNGQPVRVAVEAEMSFSLQGEPRLDSPEVSKAGPGVVMPSVLKEVKPDYTTPAREAGIQGTVTLDCVVRSDGSVGETRVTRGLDPGLDAQAIAALKQWQFKPGKRDGKAVPT